MKKNILHFIYDLGRGGAETMMVRVIKALPEYNHIVVTLYPYDRLSKEMTCDVFICLNQQSLFLFPLSAIRLRKIIRRYKVDLVHTHLFWPTVIARIGVPKKIPLVTTIHAFIKTSVEYSNWHIRLLDRVSYNFHRSVIIAVAKGALDEYFSLLRIKPFKAYVLYTFADTDKFILPVSLSAKNEEEWFSVISVGALRFQKNHLFLINAFKKLKHEKIELHIYGEGPLKQSLQQLINEEPGVNVILKGEVSNIHELLPKYDLFVLASSFEGFSLSVLEAMAVKMPLLLSDIASFREQCEGLAVFFKLNDVDDFVQKLHILSTDKAQLKSMGEKGFEKMTADFTLTKHINGLRQIYEDVFRGV